MASSKPQAKPQAEGDALLAAMRHIAALNPFQRSRRGFSTCLFCETAESKPRPEPSKHQDDCLWRRAIAAGTSARRSEVESVASDFAEAGPWLRRGAEGIRVCAFCKEPEPMHSSGCVYWRLELRRLTAD